MVNRRWNLVLVPTYCDRRHVAEFVEVPVRTASFDSVRVERGSRVKRFFSLTKNG